MIAASATSWYVARSGGVVAYGLISLTVVLGLLLSVRTPLADWPRFALEDVHRFAGLLAGSFVAVHVLALLLDGFINFSVVEIVVPFASSYRRVAAAAGAIAFDLLVALALSNALRRRLPHSVWRRLHLLAFPVWLLATVHGLVIGSDAGSWWVVPIYVLAIGSVAVLLAQRVLVESRGWNGSPSRPAERDAARRRRSRPESGAAPGVPDRWSS